MANIHPASVGVYIVLGAIFSYYADLERDRSINYCWFAFFFWPLIALKGLLKGTWEFFTEW